MTSSSRSQWYHKETDTLTDIKSILKGTDVTASFQELTRIRNGLNKLKQEKLQKQEKLLHQQREYERVKSSLDKKSSDLEKKKKEMEMRISISSTQKNTIPIDLQRQRTAQTEGGTGRLISVHREYISKILECLKHNLNDLLSCKPDAPSVADTKDLYRFYGFLLSACNLKDAAPRSNDSEVQKVYDSLESIDHRKEELKPHIEKAINLTRSMLILLPPLVVCRPQQYEEDVHDTNRLTWDETRARDQFTAPLIYYRPVLVYGNHLEVAVKGLVGNSLVEIRERSEPEEEPSKSSSGHDMDSAGKGARPGDQKMPMYLRQSCDTSSSSRQQQSESKEMDRPWKNDTSDPRLTKPQDKFQGYPPSTNAPDKAAKDSDVSTIIQKLQDIQKLQENQDKSTTTSTTWKPPGHYYSCTVCGKPVEASNAVCTGNQQFAHITCCRCAHCPNNGYWIINNGQILCSYHFKHVPCLYCPSEGPCQMCRRTWSYQKRY